MRFVRHNGAMVLGLTALGLMGAQAALANPLGGGLFDLSAKTLQEGRVQTGDYTDTGVPVHANEAENSFGNFESELSLPVGRGIGVIGDVSQFGSTVGKTLTEKGGNVGGYAFNQTTVSQEWDLTTRVWLSEFFREPFALDKHSNPDGRLLWPQLTLRGSWENDNTITDITDRSGVFAGDPDILPNHEETFSGHYGLVIPISRFVSVNGSYGEAYSHYVLSGSSATLSGGFSDFTAVGAAFFFKWNPYLEDDEAGESFPLLGRSGWARVDLYYNNQYVRSSGRMTSEVVGALLRVPITPLVAAGFGYESDSTDQGYFDTIQGFSTSQYNLSLNRFRFSLTMSLGALLK